MRDKVYRWKSAEPSTFFADVYDTLLLYILDWSCGPKNSTSHVDRQIGTQDGRRCLAFPWKCSPLCCAA